VSLPQNNQLIVGTRHCRVLILGKINSDATGFDRNPLISFPVAVQEIRTRQCRFPTQNNIVGTRQCRVLYVIPVQPELI
jgi:hypothetical protein